MIINLDIYRTANELIKQHGDQARFLAAMRAGELLEAGDVDGHVTWFRIIKAIEEVLSQMPREGDAVH